MPGKLEVEAPLQPPVLLLSHGTTMLSGERSQIRDYWKSQGDKALEYGIKGVIIMVSSAALVLFPNCVLIVISF